jgi:exo-beta-1,3-glucanase (GH17 family)
MRLQSMMVVAVIGMTSAATVWGAAPTNFPSYKPFYGIAYSPFQGNETPNFGVYPSVAEISQDLTNRVAYLCSEIATYGMDGTLSNIPALCNAYGIKCYPCAYLNTNNPADNAYELAALIAVGNQNFPTTRGLIVGSESLLQGYDPSTLISNIDYVRAATHNAVPVGTREVPGMLVNYPDVVAACDFVQADIYAYWAQESVTNAAEWTVQQWQALTEQFPGVKIEIGEANWPTGGTNAYFDDPNVVPSVANQSRFLSEFTSLADSDGIEYFIFALRDESWKVQSGYGTVDTNWGVMDGDSNKKSSLVNLLSAGFDLRLQPVNATSANLVVPTYEADPYLLVSMTNLLVPGAAGNFMGAAGTNRTVITVTNLGGQPAGFYRVSQNF